jgi:hypothetical protein
MDLMTEFWKMNKKELHSIRQELGPKLLEAMHIEELRYNQMWVADFYRTDCSNVDIFVQQYLILHIFAMFDHFKEELLEALPHDRQFVETYWDYLQRCCADSLKVECTIAVESAIPRMVETLKTSWERRSIPAFETFQEQYDPKLFETKELPPPIAPIKRGRPKQGGRTKRQKAE